MNKTKINPLHQINTQLQEKYPAPHNRQEWQKAVSQTRFMVQDEPPKSIPFGTVAFRRLGFGPKMGDLAAFRALGSSDAACMRAYIEQQLKPNEVDDYDCKLILAKHPSWHIYRQSSWQLWQDYAQNTADWDMRMRPLETTEQITFLRAIHSKKQLFEKLVSFWRNHFYLDGRAYNTAPLMPDFDTIVLRTHTLGNFRQLLKTAVSHPAMLQAYRNDENRVRQHNLTFASVLLNDFTLGERNYFGDKRPDQVPKDDEGRPIGYTDDDVRGAARSLTGWTARDGRFQYRHDWHDVAGKWVMDLYLPPGQPHRADGDLLLDWLAIHPATAHHICTKLCRFFYGKKPPTDLIKSAATLFLEHKDHPEQLTHVIRHILYTKFLLTTWGNAQPTYFAHVSTILRALDTPISFHPHDEATQSLLLLLRLEGQALFNGKKRKRRPQDIGTIIYWLLMQHKQKELSQQIVESPAGERTPDQLIRYWNQRLLGTQLPDIAHHAITDTLAQGQPREAPLSRDMQTEHGRAALFRLRVALAQIMHHPISFRI